MNASSDSPIIAEVIGIARRAGELIMSVFGADDLAIQHKADDSPQSRADRDASQLITAALRATFNEPVVSEEERVPWEVRRQWQVLWLVDPLDGSREFLAGIEEFAVSIARVHRGAPTHGVLLMPATGTIYGAIRDQGAFVVDATGEHALPRQTPPALIQAVSRYHHVPEADAFATLNGYSTLRPTGSALKFGMLADGALAVYPRFEECKEWDTAAGQLILTEAGGAMLDITTGQAPVYNKPQFPNNAFLACAPGVDITELVLPEGVISR